MYVYIIPGLVHAAAPLTDGTDLEERVATGVTHRRAAHPTPTRG